MKSPQLNKIVFIINLFALFYFCFLVLASVMTWDAQALQILAELITIPLIAIVFLSLGYGVYQLLNKTKMKWTIPMLILCLLSITVTVIATVNRL